MTLSEAEVLKSRVRARLPDVEGRITYSSRANTVKGPQAEVASAAGHEAKNSI